MTDRRRVLVTTGLPGTWRESDSVLMLGPWCMASRANDAEERLPQKIAVAPFHWDDREKLASDYAYLQTLHDRLLDVLATALNRFHGTAHSRRYWQILLDPWLMAYLGVGFDRWESLRLVMRDGELFETVLPEVSGEEEPPFSYAEFIERAISDQWNLGSIGRMIEFQYGGQCAFREERRPMTAKVEFAVRGHTRRASVAGKIAAWLDGVPAAASVRNRIVFFQAYFGVAALVRLSLKMRLVPRAYLKEFPIVESRADLGRGGVLVDRSTLQVDFKPGNDFERYVVAHIARDLPTCTVDDHDILAARAHEVRLRPTLIVTANAHWAHVPAKAWMAQRVEAGARLLVLEHGGSFPARRELFDFEEDISDLRGTWFKPYHPKHVQVPPSKLIGRRKGRAAVADDAAACCLIVGNESPKWVFRVHFYPMADQCMRSYQLTTDMIAQLRGPAAAAVRIRPAGNWGWNFAARYREQFGPQALLQGGSLRDAFDRARLIVCTYPETTFSEAMASGKPAVLVYPPEVYERHPVASGLLQQMRDAGIVFHDSREAAAHINDVWGNASAWWNSAGVVAAREAFFETALQIKGDWLASWAAVLDSALKPVLRHSPSQLSGI